ncbi:LuxR C-terminal-related transcriptional regulator [Actinoplanes sp. NPDC051861]|uniref:helix-turn-helix transcriptional regulator n=1 Tax=Actinoplanes sp. NPDC051861 TaxID=3155170 RepID=UPI00342CBDEF
MVVAAGFVDRILELVLAGMSDVESGTDVWQRIFDELGELLDVSVGGILDVQRDGLATATVTAWPGWATAIRVTAEENNGYPLVRHYAATVDPLPRTLDDVPDDMRWRTSHRYARMRDGLRAGHHLMMPLRQDRRSVRLFGFARAGGDFTAAERERIVRLQRVVSALDRHQAVVSSWRDARPAPAPPARQLIGEHGITPRELAVLTLLAEGLTVAATARRLGIAPRTVAKHQENLQRKLATCDRLNTVLRAQRLGLVPVPDPSAHAGQAESADTISRCG